MGEDDYPTSLRKFLSMISTHDNRGEQKFSINWIYWIYPKNIYIGSIIPETVIASVIFFVILFLIIIIITKKISFVIYWNYQDNIYKIKLSSLLFGIFFSIFSLVKFFWFSVWFFLFGSVITHNFFQ